MSHTQTPNPSQKKQRSQLAVPGNQTKFFEKSAASNADAIFLDLEDSVSISEKNQARTNVIQALNDIDWGNKLMLVRINGLDTPHMYKDVIELVSHCPRLDRLLLPKVGVAADIYALDLLVSQVEMNIKRKQPIQFDCLIETALGMTNVNEIAKSSTRLRAFSFGLADYAASIGMKCQDIGGHANDYGVLSQHNTFTNSDIWHYARMQMLNACRAYGLIAIDGPFGDISNHEAYLNHANGVAAMGYCGKWAIHPSQIDLANQVFTPSDDEVSQAKAIVNAMLVAKKQGLGAATHNGKLIDIASIKMAENILLQA